MHTTLLPVSQALEGRGLERTVQDMLKGLRCAYCGERDLRRQSLAVG
jgi:hypothetical protein